jgi:hypothetical protein
MAGLLGVDAIDDVAKVIGEAGGEGAAGAQAQ